MTTRTLRLRLAHWLHPYWQQTEIDAVLWRTHLQRHRLGLVQCSDDHMGKVQEYPNQARPEWITTREGVQE